MTEDYPDSSQWPLLGRIVRAALVGAQLSPYAHFRLEHV